MMRLVWLMVALAMVVCVLMCAICDSEGARREAWWWGGAAIAVGFLALALVVAEGWPRAGAPDVPELPVVYDQSIDTRM